MKPKPLIWHVFSSYLLVIALSVFVIAGYTSRSVRALYQEQVSSDLEIRARVIGDRFTEQLQRGAPNSANDLCRALSQEISARITIILPSGTVAGDSEEDSAKMDNHRDRQEVRDAIEKGIGTSIRFSHTLKKDMMYVALPLRKDGQLLGIVRVACPLTRLAAALEMVYVKMIAAGAAAALGAAAISWFVSRRFARSLNAMKQGAERFARGDLSKPVLVQGAREISTLAGGLNQMARQLDDRIRTVLSQRNQQEAVLSSMVEGVIAVDTQHRIISLNQTAARLIGVALEEAQGLALDAVVTNPALKEFVLHALGSPIPSEDEIVIQGQETQILQAHGTVLRDAHGEAIGAVVVLNDVTRLRRLEQVRRDFVANVSHELRTPITSIKGFVETLLDGALNSPEDARRFLQIVARQADRLNAILGDLLTLSRIEEEEKAGSIKVEQSVLRETLASAIQLCQNKAAERGIHIELVCDPAIAAAYNASLVEQAVANLVDNALKYSEAGERVRVSGSRENDEVVIRVEDHGSGIPPEHVPRLFERFYRVDKARSRSLGGTGLGLSIVKHIVKAHGGRVSVDSTVGQGSTFAIYLPVA